MTRLRQRFANDDDTRVHGQLAYDSVINAAVDPENPTEAELIQARNARREAMVAFCDMKVDELTGGQS